MYRFLAFLAFAFLTCTTSAAARAGVFDVESFRLENGLRVVVIANHRAPVVSHMVWYGFGQADEKAGESGIAHFLEHLMFKGTPSVPDGLFSKTVKAMGGNDNAFTASDYTAYYQNVPKAFLPRVMEMEADRMQNLVLEEKAVLSERDVVIEERRMRVDNQPQSLFREQMLNALYMNHPYATPVIGWRHEIAALTREQALDYYRQWYKPNNAILVVAGDVSAAELKPLAEKYYGAIAPAPLPPRQRMTPAPLLAARRLSMTDPRAGQPALTRLYRAPRGSDALDIFAEIAGGTSTARLYKSLVVEQKLAVAAGMQYDPVSLNDTALSVYASPAPDVDIAQLESALDREIAKLLEAGIAEDELAAAKKRKTASFLYYLDSLQGPAMLFGRALASGFDVDHVTGWPDRVARLTVAQVNDAARAVFSGPNRPVTGVLMPPSPAQNRKTP